MTTKAWKIVYYITTVLLSALMLMSGFFGFRPTPDAFELMAHLGYPMYVLTMLSAAKILGVIGIWQTKWPAVREWAYAGFFYDVAGAMLSFIAVGDGPDQYLPLAGMLIVLVLGSYVSMKKVNASAI